MSAPSTASPRLETEVFAAPDSYPSPTLDRRAKEAGSNLAARQASRDLFLRRSLFVFGTVALLLYVSVQPVSGGLLRVLVPFSLASALCFWPLLAARNADPFEPASIAGLHMGVGLVSSLFGALAKERVDFDLLPSLSPAAAEELAATIGWAFVLGQTAYLIGYYSTVGSRLKQSFPRISGLGWDPSRVALVIVGCLLVALPVYAYFQAKAGTAIWNLTNLSAGKAVWREDPTQTWIFRGVLLGLIPPMLYLGLAMKGGSRRRQVVAVIAAVITAALVLRLGQRGVVAMFLASCGMIVHYLRRRIPVSAVFGGIFVLLALSNVLLAFRQASDPTLVDTDFSMQRFRPTQVLSEHEQDRSRLSTMGVVFHTFPDRHEFLLGESWLGAPVLLIPQWIWPNKWDPFIWRDTYLVYHLTGAPMPTPYLGLLYANFSWIGIVLGMFLWGTVQRGLYEWLRAAGPDPSTVLLYSNLVFVSAPTLFGVQHLIQFGLPIYLILFFIGRRSLPPTPSRRRALPR
jgi:hypothetical protein